MDKTVIDDLKQFIDVTVTRRTGEVVEALLDKKLDEKLDAKLDEKLAPIHQKIDDLMLYVADAIGTSNDAHDKRLNDHERRITRLEKVRY